MGEMSEWLKEHAWKACVGETLPRVRIPLSPPNLARARFGASSGLQASRHSRLRRLWRLGSNPFNSNLARARFGASSGLQAGAFLSPRLGSNPSERLASLAAIPQSGLLRSPRT